MMRQRRRAYPILVSFRLGRINRWNAWLEAHLNDWQPV